MNHFAKPALVAISTTPNATAGSDAIVGRPAAITNNTLSQSLDDLEEKRLVDREIVSEKPVAVEYSLTERGQSLQLVIDSLEEWGKTYLRPVESEANATC